MDKNLPSLMSSKIDDKVEIKPPSRRKKTGGRLKGSKNKRKAVAELMSDVVVKAVHEGETPLEYMLRVMRDRTQEHIRRDEMAKAAAPYVHARLNAVDVNHDVNDRIDDDTNIVQFDQVTIARVYRRVVSVRG